MSLLKAELLHARTKKHGLTLQQRLVSSVDFLGRMGTMFPGLTNFFFSSRSMRHVFGKVFGFASERSTPEFAKQRFDRWFQKRAHDTHGQRGRVVLWDDTFTRYHEPHIGIAAVKVLEAAGFYVTLAQQRQCCGRPAFSVGHLDAAQKLGAHNLALLANDDAPVIFLEPSCYSMFKEDYRELKLPDAEAVAARCILFEDFVENLLREEPDTLKFDHEHGRIVIHTHCHAKALTNPKDALQLVSRLHNRTTALLETGCCGMAGAFGMRADKYELSLKIAEPLIEQIKHQPYGTTVVLSGTSCRHQVEHLATARIRHMAEVLAEALL
jgi:Fe-S oxidoreductase